MVTFSLQRVTFVVTYERISDCACDRLTENCSQRRWGGCGGHHWFGKHFWNQWYLRQDSASKQGKHQPTDVRYSSKGWPPWIKGWMGALKYWVASKHCQETWALAWLFKAAWVLESLISECLHSHLPTYLPTCLHAYILQWFPCLFRCSAAACWKKSDRLGTLLRSALRDAVWGKPVSLWDAFLRFLVAREHLSVVL